MEIFISRRSLFIRALGVMLLVSSTLCYFLFPNEAFLILAFCILLNILLIFQNRHSKPLVLFYIFLFSYLWVLTNYFFAGREITFHRDFRTQGFYDKGLYLFSVFLAFLSLFNNQDVQQLPVRARLHLKKDPIIFWLNVVILIIITIYGKRGQNIFQSGSYGQGTVQSSSLNEYYYIFFVVAFIFSGGKKLLKRVLLILAFIYCVKNILFGGRVEVVQLVLLIFILMFENELSSPLFYLLLIIGFMLFTAFSHVRANPLLLLHPNLKEIFFGTSSAKIVASNQGDVWQAMVRMTAMADTHIITFFDRIYSFILFLLSAFIPYSKLPALANLSNYKAGQYSTGGGGLLFGYFYVWLWYPGIILIAFVLNRIFALFLKARKQIFLVYGILVLCTFPRWFAYIPVDLIKLCVIGAVYYFFMSALHNSVYGILKNRSQPSLR